MYINKIINDLWPCKDSIFNFTSLIKQKCLKRNTALLLVFIPSGLWHAKSWALPRLQLFSGPKWLSTLQLSMTNRPRTFLRAGSISDHFCDPWGSQGHPRDSGLTCPKWDPGFSIFRNFQEDSYLQPGLRTTGP